MIPKEINDTLKKKYCPEDSDLRKAQLRMLEMMKYVDAVCSENNITYWLDSGTLLGAVRHGGFIPWDDDVDLCINRKDAKKLIKAIKEKPHPDFVLQDRSTDKNHWREWFTIRDIQTEYIQDSFFHNQQKFKGLQVDIFLTEENVSHVLWKISSWLYALKLYFVKKRFKLLAVLLHYFDRIILFPFFRLVCKVIPTGHRKQLHKVYGQVFDHYVSIEDVLPVQSVKFEGIAFKAPHNPESYLIEHYGNDYMELPSEETLSRYNHNVSIIFH